MIGNVLKSDYRLSRRRTRLTKNILVLVRLKSARGFIVYRYNHIKPTRCVSFISLRNKTVFNVAASTECVRSAHIIHIT